MICQHPANWNVWQVCHNSITSSCYTAQKKTIVNINNNANSDMTANTISTCNISCAKFCVTYLLADLDTNQHNNVRAISKPNRVL